jgi:hypothetical protein
MVVDLFRWPPKARQFQEAIAAAVESFSREGRSYNYARSACEQLRERILERFVCQRSWKHSSW